ncbi:hypothetical protein L1049_026215 [Liquidambar formosana]|uniref:AB hydrolase-1 domain-containing protein n=1 Tax=Liquidambar formosana TaxID=63359 RepID=A0AAP0NCY0_LIQFO
MSAISNLVGCQGGEISVKFSERRLGFGFSGNGITRISRRFQGDTFRTSRLALSHSRRAAKDPFIRMALVDERLAHGTDVTKPSGVLAYDLVQGALVRWSSFMDTSIPDPPTAVLLHGILGCRKNWGTFARRLAQEFPTWQFLLVDLRCHGESASIKKRGPHTVASAALDVLKLVAKLRITPRVLVGHSFGGKVVLSMVEQAAKPSCTTSSSLGSRCYSWKSPTWW